jgi:hypothetical protein
MERNGQSLEAERAFHRKRNGTFHQKRNGAFIASGIGVHRKRSGKSIRSGMGRSIGSGKGIIGRNGAFHRKRGRSIEGEWGFIGSGKAFHQKRNGAFPGRARVHACQKKPRRKGPPLCRRLERSPKGEATDDCLNFHPPKKPSIPHSFLFSSPNRRATPPPQARL